MKNLSLVLLSILILFACKKEEDKKSELIEALSKNEWKKLSIAISPDTITSNPADTMTTISVATESCKADNIWIFNANNNSFILDEGATKCDIANPQIKDQGSITDINNGAQLKVAGTTTNEIWEIESRSASSFRVSYFSRVANMSRKFRVTFTKI